MSLSSVPGVTGTAANYQAAQVTRNQPMAGDPDGDNDVESAENSTQQAQETGAGVSFNQLG